MHFFTASVQINRLLITPSHLLGLSLFWDCGVSLGLVKTYPHPFANWGKGPRGGACIELFSDHVDT